MSRLATCRHSLASKMLQDVPNVVGGHVNSDCSRNLASCRQALNAESGKILIQSRFRYRYCIEQIKMRCASCDEVKF